MDEAAHIIVAAELDNVAPDANWLLPMVQAVKDNLGELPALELADAGYRSEYNLTNALLHADHRLAPIRRSVTGGGKPWQVSLPELVRHVLMMSMG